MLGRWWSYLCFTSFLMSGAGEMLLFVSWGKYWGYAEKERDKDPDTQSYQLPKHKYGLKNRIWWLRIFKGSDCLFRFLFLPTWTEQIVQWNWSYAIKPPEGTISFAVCEDIHKHNIFVKLFLFQFLPANLWMFQMCYAQSMCGTFASRVQWTKHWYFSLVVVLFYPVTCSHDVLVWSCDTAEK